MIIFSQVIAHLSLCDNHIHSEGGKFLGRALQVPQKSHSNSKRELQKSPTNTLQVPQKGPTHDERALSTGPFALDPTP